MTAEQLCRVPSDSRVRVADLVTQRQRPESANGVTFVTLEDETGHINAVAWRDLGERQRKPLLRSHLMSISGDVQRDGDGIHVVARNIEDYSPFLGRLRTESRDFR